MENEYELSYCDHFGVSAITLSGVIVEIRFFHSFDVNRVQVTTSQTAIMNKEPHLTQCLILNMPLQNTWHDLELWVVEPMS